MTELEQAYKDAEMWEGKFILAEAKLNAIRTILRDEPTAYKSLDTVIFDEIRSPYADKISRMCRIKGIKNFADFIRLYNESKDGRWEFRLNGMGRKTMLELQKFLENHNIQL